MLDRAREEPQVGHGTRDIHRPRETNRLAGVDALGTRVGLQVGFDARGNVVQETGALRSRKSRPAIERTAGQVRSGFERGLADAKELIKGLAALTPELEGDIDRTESLVRQGLDEFFASERERYATAA